jgi:EAL domain-containing protein (putative c-di-GMP-specific phosphodiesterase class I)
VEALLRWRHPLHGAVPAETIVRVAEETGTIGALTEWVLRAGTLAAAGLPDNVGLTINVSAAQLALPTFPHLLVSAIAGAGLAPGRLCLEVAATCLDDAAARRGLSTATGLGVRIAIDRFDGRVALAGITEDVGVSAVKLDRALIADIDADPNGRTLLRSVVELARTAGLSTIAVGVEADAEMRAAVEAGCVCAQGFHVAPPMSFEALAERLGCRNAAVAPVASPRQIDVSLRELFPDTTLPERARAEAAVAIATVA